MQLKPDARCVLARDKGSLMKHTWHSFLYFVLAVLVLLSTGTTAPAQTTPTLDSEEWNFLIAINNFRQQNGVAPLQVSIALENAAQWMSSDMAAHNYYGYVDSLGRAPAARIATFGYSYTWAEAIAEGYPAGESIFGQWLANCTANSSGACTYGYQKMMLNTSYKVIGIGRAYNASSTDGWYWDIDFGETVDAVLNATPPAPSISYFTAVPASISAGSSTTLYWSITGATTTTINQGVGDVSLVTFKSVTPSATTTYTLTAKNAGGSTTAQVTVTVGGGTVTQPPTTPSLSSVTAKSPTDVVLAWTASTSSAGIANYQITRNGSALTSVSGTTLSYADTSVSPNTSYTYSIKVVDTAGNTSAASNSLTATTPPLTVAAPVISSFTAAPTSLVAGQSATLSWSVAGATSLSLNNGIGSLIGLTSKSVSPTTTTTYTLTATNSGGSVTSSVTITVSATDNQPPSTPTLLTATAKSATEVDLSWTASSDNVGVAGYQISRSGAGPVTISGGATAYADTSASPSTTYIYFVRAFDAAGNYSGASMSMGVTTPSSASPMTCPAAGSSAFTGCYYNNITLSGSPVFTRTDGAINFTWGATPPSNTLTSDNFSVRWQGDFNFTAGSHTFTVTTSDGMRLYIDGTIILDEWMDQAAATYTATTTLTAGTHLVVVEYYEHTNGSKATVTWQ